MPLRLAVLFVCFAIAAAENPYKHFDWIVTYGNIQPFGVPQQGILINGLFPGPVLNATTNDNVIVNVHNRLDEPFLINWNGIQNRRNSFVDGSLGTTCPIPPGQNNTYVLQMKDQIGSYYYFPTTAFHKAAGGFGGITLLSRAQIPVPFDRHVVEFTLLIGDWYKKNHKFLKQVLDKGRKLPEPYGVLINGLSNTSTFKVEQGKTYRLRICNVGLQNSLNFRIQGHDMTLVEVEGTHVVKNNYTSLDFHVGQCMSVLVTADQKVNKAYYIVVSTRFNKKILTTTGVLHYLNSHGPPSGPLPAGPPTGINWSLEQARSIRTNLTASGPRPNPQGSYHYGKIPLLKTVKISSSAGQVKGKQRYALNGVSHVNGATPLKLADYFNISGVFRVGSLPVVPPTGKGMHLRKSVLGLDYRTFIEIVFENKENIMQSYHLSGYVGWAVGMDKGNWTTASRKQYNLCDAVTRSTFQVYPKSWTAIYIALDNVGMWNLRSGFWARQYLGQQTYLRVYTTSKSWRDENPIPKNVLLCGKAKGRQISP